MANVKQGGINRLARLLDYAAYKEVYQTIKKEIHNKGQRPADKCPQDRTGEDTLTEEQFIAIVKRMINLPDSAAARDLSMWLWMACILGRSDDARLMHVADLLKPHLVRSIGTVFQQKQGELLT